MGNTMLIDERMEAIAQVAGRDPAVVRWMYEADWGDGGATQTWMETAPLQEVGDWVACCPA